MISLNSGLFTGKASKIGALLVIKIIGALFATLVFAHFTPLVDANLYLSGSYGLDSNLRTLMVQTLAVMLNGFGGALFTHVIFGIISTAGILYYIATGGKRWEIILILLFPTSLIWTSIVSKEALFFGGFTLLLVIWSRYVNDVLNRIDLFAAIIAICVCGLLRPHYAVVVLWLFFSVGIVKKYGGKAWPILLATMLLGALAIYFFVWTDLLVRGLGSSDPMARASRYQMFDIQQGVLIGLERFKQFIPLGIIFGIVGPLPEELLRPEFIPFFIEGVLILLFPLLVYVYARSRNFREKSLFLQYYWWCLIPAIIALMVLHSPFGLFNPGSAIRWRTNFESIFYIAPLLLLFQFRNDIRNENSSLSS